MFQNEMQKYIAEVEDAKKTLYFIHSAIEELLKKYHSKKEQVLLKKQEQFFHMFVLNDKNRSTKKYFEKTKQNLKGIFISYDVNDIKSFFKDNDKYKLNLNNINKVTGVLRGEISKDIMKLSELYFDTLDNIKQIQYIMNDIEQGNVKPIIKGEPKPTVDKKNKFDNYDIKINENAGKIINGPKKKSIKDIIFGNDIDYQDMRYLYGLAADILLIMMNNQKVDVYKHSVENISSVSSSLLFVGSDYEYQKTQIFNKYGVFSVEQLIDKYDNIRNSYYNNYLKLDSRQKSKYECSADNFGDFNKIESSFSNNFSVVKAMLNENLLFPPKKEELIKLINNRILNSKYFQFVLPKKIINENEEIFPESIEQYEKVKSNYKNLTKNMSLEEIAQLYRSAQKYVEQVADSQYRMNFDVQNISSKDFVCSYTVLIQKLFCEIVLEKESKKFTDNGEYYLEMKRIARELFNEEFGFGDKINYRINSKSNFNDDITKSTINSKENNLGDELYDLLYEKYLEYKVMVGSSNNPLSFEEYLNLYYPNYSNLNVDDEVDTKRSR